jgi:hypothetical protein
LKKKITIRPNLSNKGIFRTIDPISDWDSIDLFQELLEEQQKDVRKLESILEIKKLALKQLRENPEEKRIREVRYRSASPHEIDVSRKNRSPRKTKEGGDQ